MALNPSKLIAAGLSANAVAALTDGQQATANSITAINTVGAGVLTAAGLVSGVITRGGAQSATAFSDATDTAVNIVAAMTNVQVGQSFKCVIKNTTDGKMTVTGGTGVTIAGQSTVQKNCWVEYVVVLTSLTAVAMTGVESGANLHLPKTNYITQATGNQTAAAGELLAARFSVLSLTANGANAYTTRTGALMAGDIPDIQIGMSWIQRICANGDNTVTLTAALSGITITGTATVATTTYRDYVVTYTAANTFVFQNIGGGSI